MDVSDKSNGAVRPGSPLVDTNSEGSGKEGNLDDFEQEESGDDEGSDQKHTTSDAAFESDTEGHDIVEKSGAALEDNVSINAGIEQNDDNSNSLFSCRENKYWNA